MPSAEDSQENSTSFSEFSLAESLKEELQDMKKSGVERFSWINMPRGLACIEMCVGVFYWL